MTHKIILHLPGFPNVEKFIIRPFNKLLLNFLQWSACNGYIGIKTL